MDIFSPEQLSKVITETLPAEALPGEKVVVFTTDGRGATVAAGFKFNATAGEWELKAAAHVETDEHGRLNVSGGASAVLRWQ